MASQILVLQEATVRGRFVLRRRHRMRRTNRQSRHSPERVPSSVPALCHPAPGKMWCPPMSAAMEMPRVPRFRAAARSKAAVQHHRDVSRPVAQQRHVGRRLSSNCRHRGLKEAEVRQTIQMVRTVPIVRPLIQRRTEKSCKQGRSMRSSRG